MAVYWVLSSRPLWKSGGKEDPARRTAWEREAEGKETGVEALALLTDVCWLLIWATNPIYMTFGWSAGLVFLSFFVRSQTFFAATTPG